MFRILDRNRKVIGLLQSPIDPKIEEAINGMSELSFSVPSSFKGLELEGYIQIENEHEYVIKEIVTHGTNREVVAIMNVEELFGNSWVTFRSVDTNVYDCMREILSGTNWRAVNQSTREVTRSLLGSNTTSWDLISQFCSIYDVEVKFDTYKKEVTIVDRLGGDLGVYFMNELNLKQLNHDSHTHKYITQVIPIGKNGMTIEDINDGKLYVTDYTYTDKKITGIWKADSYNNKQALKEDAQKFLAEMAVPYQTYECLVVDLNRVSRASNFAYDIGDIITIIDNTTNQRVKQRIIKQTRYLIDPSSNSIQIANKNMTFQDYYKRLQMIANMTEQIMNGDGTISTDKVEVGDAELVIKADSILAEHIKAEQIFARHIVADNITAEHIKAEQIDTRHLKANIINAGHIQAGSITAGSGIIAEGAIGDAQISNVNANKINAGEIDTSKVRVSGRDGFLFIENNTLYVVDNDRQIRVELGAIEDSTNYGFIVRGSDGETILIDHTGVKNAGITDGAVDNRTVSENANISGKKLDINSVIRSINEDGSVKITGTVVQVGDGTLEVKMSEQNNLITQQGQKLENQQSQITSNTNAIKLKVDNQTYQSDKQGMESKLEKHTSEISVLQEEIKLKVGQTEIDKVKDEVSGTVDTKINEAMAEFVVDTEGIKQSVSQLTNETKELDGKISAHEVRLSTAESKITPEAITSTVSSQFVSKGDADKKYASQSQVTQLSNQISSKVDANGVNSIIKQNPDSIRIGFNGIDNRTQIDTNGLSMYNPNGIKTTMLKLGNIYQYNGVTGTFLGGYLSARNSSSNNLGVVGGYYTKQWIVSRSSGWQNDNDNNPSGVTDYFFVNFVDTGGNRTGIHLASNTYAHSSIQMQGNDIVNAGVMNANVSKFRTWRDTSNVIAMDCNPDGKIYLGKHINTNGFSVSNSSDSRLKQDIKYVDETTYNIEEGREENLKSTLYKEFKDNFKFATYRYKREELKDKEHFGFMAQDLLGTVFEKYILDNPNSECAGEDYLTYDLTELTTVIAGVLQEEISVRDKQIADLEARLERLEKLVSVS